MYKVPPVIILYIPQTRRYQMELSREIPANHPRFSGDDPKPEGVVVILEYPGDDYGLGFWNPEFNYWNYIVDDQEGDPKGYCLASPGDLEAPIAWMPRFEGDFDFENMDFDDD